MDTYLQIQVYTQVSIQTYTSLLYQLRKPKSNGTPVAIETPSTQILVSKTILQQKERGLLGEMTDSGTGIHDHEAMSFESPALMDCT